MMAPLQLIDFRAEVLAYERLEADPWPDDVEYGVALTFQLGASYDEDRDAQRLMLEIEYNEKDVPEEVAPYIAHRGRIRVTGWLRWSDGEVAERDDAQRLLLTNGLTILYGIARVRVADLTEGGDEDRLLLPSVSFLPIVDDWLSNTEIASDAEPEADS